MDFTDIRLDEFINNIIKCNSIDDILDKCKTQSLKGFVFERLWDIIIKFGFCPIFSNSKFIHKIGNVDDCSLKNLENLNSYLNNEKVYSGNKEIRINNLFVLHLLTFKTPIFINNIDKN